MTSRVMRGGLTAGLILIALGVIFLIENLYAPFSVLRLLARYWPLILVGAGIGKIYRHFTWPEVPPPVAEGPIAPPAKHRRPPTLLGGLLWTGFGLLFLLHNFGIGPDVWSLAIRWWPVLLILLGLGKIVEYSLHRESVAVRAGELIGILALVLLGSAVTRLQNSPIREIMRDAQFRIGDARVRPGEWFGTSHSFTQEESYPQERVRPVRIENSYGSVSVVPGPEGEIGVRLNKVVFAAEAEAAAIAGDLSLETPPAASGEDVFVIRTNRDLLGDRRLRFNTHLEVRVPKNSRVQIRNAFGEIRVSGIHGDMDLGTTHRRIEVADCTGPFTLSARYAESRLTNLEGNVNLDSRGKVYAENIRGDMTVKDEYSPVELINIEGKVTLQSTDGSIRVENVSGPVVIETRGAPVTARGLKQGLRLTASHADASLSDVASALSIESRYGTLKLENIRGTVEIRSNSDRIRADDIEGNFRLRGRSSSLRLNRLRGDADLETSLKDLIVRGLGGAASISNQHGGIRVSPLAPLGTLDIKNRGGNIELLLPGEAAFSLGARARNGNIRTDYPGLPGAGRGGGAMQLEAQVKNGGPNLSLETENGDIVVGRDEEATAPGTRRGNTL